MEDIKRKCNSMMDLLKFTSNKKILSEVATISYNQVYSQILSIQINYICSQKKKKKKLDNIFGAKFVKLYYFNNFLSK